MSIKMYAFTCSKDRWWEFIDQLNTFYKEEHIFSKLLEHETIINEVDRLHALQQFFSNEQNQVELQIFDLSPTHFMFRVLEAGYFFINNYQRFSMLAAAFYDDRSDVPVEDLPNRILVDQMDEQIKAKHYFTYGVITAEWAFDLFQKQLQLKNIR